MKIKKLMVAVITAAWCMVSWAAGLLSEINSEYTLAGGIAPATIDLSSVKGPDGRSPFPVCRAGSNTT